MAGGEEVMFFLVGWVGVLGWVGCVYECYDTCFLLFG